MLTWEPVLSPVSVISCSDTVCVWGEGGELWRGHFISPSLSFHICSMGFKWNDFQEPFQLETLISVRSKPIDTSQASTVVCSRSRLLFLGDSGSSLSRSDTRVETARPYSEAKWVTARILCHQGCLDYGGHIASSLVQFSFKPPSFFICCLNCC